MAKQTPDRDAELVADWQSGKLRMEQVEDLSDRIMGWMCNKGLSRDDAEDLAAEVMRRVCRKIDEFRGEAKFFTWVIEFAKRVVLEHWGEQGAAQLVSLDEAPEPDAEEDPQEIALKRMAAQDALDALTPEQREVLRLHAGEQLTYEEIGTQLGITGNAAQLTGKRAAAAAGRYLKKHGWL